MRKRISGRLTSTYVGVYSEELFQLLLRNSREARELNKQIRKVNKELISLGYDDAELPLRVLENINFARANLKVNIYNQAILEGVANSFPQTEEILDNGIVNGVTVTDVQKILNLKHAWEFILDKDVLQNRTNYNVLCNIARLVNEGFFFNGGRIRGVPVTIGGSSYVPPLPLELVVKEEIEMIIVQNKESIDIAIELCLYCMKTQIFTDGNKRISVIFANHFMICKGMGFLVIPQKNVSKFKKLLVEYYEGASIDELRVFMKEKCWRNF